MPAPTPENALATVLGAAGIGLTLGTNLFDGPVTPADPSGSPSPAESVFVFPSGGPAPERTLGSGIRQISIAAIQIRVRGDRDDFTGGLALARQVRDKTQNASLGAGYLNCYVTTAEPIYIGQSEASYPEWSINAEVMYETS